MSLIGWLALGMIAGLAANALTDGRRGGRGLDLALGLAGALGGGFMFWNFGGGIRGFNGYSMVVATLGAVAALLSYHALFVYPGNGEE